MSGLENSSKNHHGILYGANAVKAFAEQQEAYLQGMIDAFQILFGLGVLSANENVEKKNNIKAKKWLTGISGGPFSHRILF